MRLSGMAHSFLTRLENERIERGRRIQACQHPAPRAAGGGYAMCDDCGALLPDEDPDLQSKAKS